MRVVGLSTAITSVRMSSVCDAARQRSMAKMESLPAIAAMSVNDILLIEQQYGWRPAETIDFILDLIRLATSQGILVVEAAGNGNDDLDAGQHRAACSA